MKKNLLTVLILALLLVNIVLTAVMMFSFMGTNKQTAKLVNNIATVLNLELTDPGEQTVAEEISLADTEIFNLTKTLTIPLADMDRTKYILFDVALSMNMKHEDYETYGPGIASRESLIQDVITTVVTSHTESECRNNFEGLKEEILEAIQNLFDSEFIYKVAISNLKFG